LSVNPLIDILPFISSYILTSKGKNNTTHRREEKEKRNGERKNRDKENRKLKQQTSNILKEKKWDLEKGKGN